MDIIVKIAWPVVVLALGLSYLFFSHGKSVVVELPTGIKINLSSEQAGKKLSELFAEFHKVYEVLLKENQKQFFRMVLAHGKVPMVKEMLPEFTHENEEHIGTLRALRGFGLIVPAGGGSWKKESRIVVTDFGKAFTSYIQNKS